MIVHFKIASEFLDSSLHIMIRMNIWLLDFIDFRPWLILIFLVNEPRKLLEPFLGSLS